MTHDTTESIGRCLTNCLQQKMLALETATAVGADRNIMEPVELFCKKGCITIFDKPVRLRGAVYADWLDAHSLEAVLSGLHQHGYNSLCAVCACLTTKGSADHLSPLPSAEQVALDLLCGDQLRNSRHASCTVLVGHDIVPLQGDNHTSLHWIACSADCKGWQSI